jgi:hypothetical protein
MTIEHTENSLGDRFVRMALTPRGEGYRPPGFFPGFFYSAKVKLQDAGVNEFAEEGGDRGVNQLSVLGYYSVFVGVGSLTRQAEGSGLSSMWPPEESHMGQDAILMRGVDSLGHPLLQLGVFDGMGSYGPNSNILTEFIIEELNKLDLAAGLSVEDYIQAIERAKASARDIIAQNLQPDDGLHEREVWAGSALAILSVGRANDNGEVPVNVFSAGDVVVFLIPARNEDSLREGIQVDTDKMSTAEKRNYVRKGGLTPIDRAMGPEDTESGNKLTNSANIVNPKKISYLKRRMGVGSESLVDKKLRQKLSEGRVDLKRGQSILVATDGFWELLEVLATNSGTTIVDYMAQILNSCEGQDDAYLAQKLDELLKQAYKSIIASLIDPAGGPAQYRADNVGFVIITAR